MSEDLWGPSLPSPSRAPTGPPVRSEPTGEQRYRDPQTVGIGGMGRVEAVHDERLDRVVARKTVRVSELGPRLLREARLTARLDHPAIVPVHDLGLDPAGRPFYTMRLVRGRSLAAVLSSLSPEDREARLALVNRVHSAAQALAYAHDQHIVHRDLKPENLMVGPYGETLVVDWGLARDLRRPEEQDLRDLSASEVDTRVGEVLGTPAFMAPEQARGEPVDERADVFALGRVLAEVLPEPAPAELVAIVACATAEDPSARYPDASALAEDLERWLAGHRVEAHDYALAELLTLRLRPWRRPLLLGLALVGVAITGLVLSTIRIDRERRRAETAETEARDLLAASRIDHGWRALRDGDLARAVEQLDLARGSSPAAVGLAMALGTERPRLLHTRERACESARIGPEGQVICFDDGQVTVDGSGEPPWEVMATDVALTPDGRLLAVEDRWLRLRGDPDWSVPTRVAGRRLVPPPSGLDAAVVNTQFAQLITLEPPRMVRVDCPGGRGLLDLAPVEDGWTATCEEGVLLRGRDTEVVEILPTEPRLLSLRWTGTDYVAGSLDGEVLRLDRQGRVLARRTLTDAGALNQLAVSPDGSTLAIRGISGVLHVLQVDTLATLTTLDLHRPRFESDTVLAGSTAEAWERWDLSGLQVRSLDTPGGVSLTTWTDAGTAAFGTGSGAVGFWDRDGLEIRHLGDAVVKGLLPWPDSDEVVAALATLPVVTRLGRDSETLLAQTGARRLTWSPDGTLIANLYSDRSRTLDGTLLEHGHLGLIATRGVDRMVYVDHAPWLSLDSPSGPVPIEQERRTGPVDMSPDGRLLAWIDRDRLVLHRFDGPRSTYPTAPGVSSIHIDPRGLILLGHTDGTLVVRSAHTGELLASARAHLDRLSTLSVRGDELLSGSWDATVRRWDLGPVLAALRD